MRIIWQLSGKNGTRQTGVKRPRQRIAKRPVAEVAQTLKGPEEARKPGGARETWEPAAAARDLRRKKETRESRKTKGGKRNGRASASCKRSGGKRETGKPVSKTALLLFWSDC